MTKTKKLSLRDYYGSAHFKPLKTYQEYIKDMVNRESWALSKTNYHTPIPKLSTPKVKWSEVVKKAFSYDITKAVQSMYP